MATTSAHKGGVCDLVYEREEPGASSSTLVSCGADGEIRVLTGESLKASTLESDEFSNSDPLRCIAFSPKESSFVTGGDDSRVVLFVKDAPASSPQKFKFDALLTRLQGRVHDVAYSRDGAWVACAGENKAVKLVSLENRQRVILLKGHEGPVKAVAFSAAIGEEGEAAAAAYVATVGTDMSLRIWRVNFGDGVAKCEKTVFKAFAKSLVNSEEFSVRLQWHPTLPLLAVPGGTTDVRVLNADGSEAFVLKGEHSDDVNVVSWRPSGDVLVSCSPSDKKLAVWSTRNLATSFEDGTLSRASASFVKVHGEYASAAICNVAWNPTSSHSDELAFADAGGMVQRLVVPILSKGSSGAKPNSKMPVEATQRDGEDDDDDDDDDLFKSRRSAKTPKKKSKKKGKKRAEKAAATTPAKMTSIDDDDAAPIVTSTRKKRSRRASRRIDDSDDDDESDHGGDGDENDHLSANVNASARKKRKLNVESASDDKPSDADKKPKRSKMKLSSILTETETQSEETQTVAFTREESEETSVTTVKSKSGKRLKKLKTTSNMSLLDDSDSDDDVDMGGGDDSYVGDGIESPTKHLASVKAAKGKSNAEEKPQANRFDDIYSQGLSVEELEAFEQKQIEEMEKAGELPETIDSAAVYASGGKPKKKHRKTKSPAAGAAKTRFTILDMDPRKLAAAGDSEESNDALMTQLGHGRGDAMEDDEEGGEGALMHSPSRPRRTSRRYAAPYLQEPFQVGSTPPTAADDDSEARFLAYNLVGRMSVRRDAPDTIVEIDFLDKAKNRAQRFKSEFEYALGALGQSGAVLAVRREADDAHELDDDRRGRARIEYKPFHAWDNLSGQWSYDLPKTEDIVSVALGLKFVAVATTLNTVRTFSFTGVQSMVFRVAGPLVAVHARDNFLAMVYHRGAAAIPDHQNLGVKLFDMSRRTQLFDGELALSPGAELKWLDFNEHGVLFAYDSRHQVSALFAHCGHMWMPVLDMRSLRRPQRSSASMAAAAANPVSVDVVEDSVFPVGFHQGKLMCVITKGRRQYPSIGAPPQLTPIDLQVPLLGINDAPLKEAGSGNGSDDEDDDEDIMKADPSYLPRMEEDHLRSSLMWREACHHMNARAPPVARTRFFEKGGEETKMKKHMDQLRVAEFFSCSETDSTKALDLCQDIQMKGALKQCVMRANDLQNPQLAQRVNTLLKRKFSKPTPQTPAAAATSSRGALNAPPSTSSTSSLAEVRARRKERRESSADGRGRRQSSQLNRVVSPPRSPSRSPPRSPPHRAAGGFRSKKKHSSVYSPNLSKNTPEFDRTESGNFKPLPRQDPHKFPPINIPASAADGDDDAAGAAGGKRGAAGDLDADTPHPDIIDLEAKQDDASGFAKILGGSNKKKQKAAARLPRHSPSKAAAGVGKRSNPFQRFGGNKKKTHTAAASSSFSLD